MSLQMVGLGLTLEFSSPAGALMFGQARCSLLSGYPVPVSSFSSWLHAHQYSGDCPADLLRRKPDNELVFELYTRQVDLDILDDKDLIGLAYLITGMSPC